MTSAAKMRLDRFSAAAAAAAAACSYTVALAFVRSVAGSFYRSMLCIRGTSHGPVSVSVSVCLPQVGVLSKRLSQSSWFLACELPSNRATLC